MRNAQPLLGNGSSLEEENLGTKVLEKQSSELTVRNCHRLQMSFGEGASGWNQSGNKYQGEGGGERDFLAPHLPDCFCPFSECFEHSLLLRERDSQGGKNCVSKWGSVQNTEEEMDTEKVF